MLLRKTNASVAKRLQLFQATVSKVVLWCAESWALTVSQKRRLRTVQRAMLRRMVGPRRRPDEDYVSWIKRATKTADERARQAGVDCWLKQFLRQKWLWAGKVAKMEANRWAKRTTLWRNSTWQAANGSRSTRPLRDRPGNRSRWEDDLRKYASHSGLGDWMAAATDEASWQSRMEDFVDFTWR